MSWNYRINFGGAITQVPAGPDGTAEVTVVTAPNTPVGVQSVSANVFTSSWAYQLGFFRPDVDGTPYTARTSAGGPGEPGTFLADAPFGTPVTAFRYLFVGESPVVLPADPSNGGAHIDLDPAGSRAGATARARAHRGRALVLRDELSSSASQVADPRGRCTS